MISRSLKFSFSVTSKKETLLEVSGIFLKFFVDKPIMLKKAPEASVQQEFISAFYYLFCFDDFLIHYWFFKPNEALAIISCSFLLIFLHYLMQ